VVSDDSGFRNSNNKDSLIKYFDLLKVNAIVTGSITDESANRNLIVQTKVYLLENPSLTTSTFDSLYLPEQKNGYYFKDTLLNAIASDILNFFNKAISSKGTWDSSLFHSDKISALDLYKNGDEMLKENNLSFAKALAQQISTHKKDSAWLGNRLSGKIEFFRNNNAAAIKYFNEALKQASNDNESSEYKGKALFEQGKFSEALAEFRKCQKDDKNFPEVHHNIALCYYQLKNDSIVIEANHALKFDADSAEIYNLLGTYFLDMKKSSFDTSIFYFKKAVLQDTSKKYLNNLNRAFYEKAYYLLDQNKLKESIPVLENIFASDSTVESLDLIRFAFAKLAVYDSVDFYIRMGIEKEKYYKPIEFFDEEEGEKDNAYLTQAEYCLSIKDTNSATSKKHLDKVFYYLNEHSKQNQSSDTYRTFEIKGSAYSEQGNYNDAILSFKESLKLFSWNLYNYLNLAEIQLINNVTQDAFQTVDTALQHIESNAYYKNRLLPEEVVISHFLNLVSKLLLDKDYKVDTDELKKILDSYQNLSTDDKQFITGWSFISFQKWLASSNIDQSKHKEISKYLNTLKEYTDPDLYSK
jgi:tetratricopeptide (TPR) repeat protein